MFEFLLGRLVEIKENQNEGSWYQSVVGHDWTWMMTIYKNRRGEELANQRILSIIKKYDNDMKHANIINLPKNRNEVAEIYSDALNVSSDIWIDEKNTIDNPIFTRKPSKLNYKEAFDLIAKNKPHWVVSYRNDSYINAQLDDYWEFSGCSIQENDYGDVFIFIKVPIEKANAIFQKYNLQVSWF